MATEPETGILTVAAVRTPKGAEGAEVLFNERHQIYTVRQTARAAAASLDLLREAAGRNVPLRATLDPRRGLIARLESPSPAEVRKFTQERTLLDKPEKTYRIDVGEIDPTRFNLVDHYLKVPVFRLCKRVVPNYKKAKEIFDFCAQQSCHLGGPFGVTPCIPFQYVRDGCYARAHKMRWIITTKYGYCCEKIFSFANQGDDVLAVQANKWGGCCVQWWYHVAPLIRVRVKLGAWSLTLALVVDPGMFDKPVLASSWLAAQENAACSSRANVSMYSIQPGTAYSPANFQGTAFTTDPNLASTNGTLIAYSGLVTC